MAIAIVEATKTPTQKTWNYYVYMLEWPSTDEQHPNEVFYVGKGTKSRLFEHEEEAVRGRQSRKCDVIRAIWASGGQVQKTIRYQTSIEQDALIYEWVLINMVYDSANLTNVQVAETIRGLPIPPRSEKPLYLLCKLRTMRGTLGLSRAGLARRTRSLSDYTIKQAEAGQHVTFEIANQILETFNNIHAAVGKSAITMEDLGLTIYN